jgi:hypothetical protein
MKKINFVLIPFIVILLWAGLSFGAACSYSVHFNHEDNNGALYVLKITRSATPADCTLPGSTKDFYFYGIATDPGTGDAEPSAYTVDLQDGQGVTMLDLSARSATAEEYSSGHVTVGQFPFVADVWTLIVGDLGAGNTTDIYLYFVK